MMGLRGSLLTTLLLLAVGFVHAENSDTARTSSRAHGLHPFGSQYLLYKDSARHYPCADPNALKGGELRLTWPVTYNKKNPFSLGGMEVPGYFLAFEPLAEVSHDDDDRLSVYGRLAEWFEISDDFQTLLIRLRDNARFSDGVQVTADDVVFSWNITGDPGYNPYVRITLSDVDKVEKVDNLTIRVTFKESSRDLPFNFCTTFYIIPQHIYGRPGTDFGKDFNELNPVGSGPYRLESDEPGSYVTWRRNPDYWGNNLWINAGRYNFDRITFKIYIDNAIQREAFAAGMIDVVDVASAREWCVDFTPEKMAAIRNNWILKHAMPNTSTPSIQAFAFNLRKPVFQDLAVRRAIASLLDFDTLNKDLFYNDYKRYDRIFIGERFRDSGPATGAVLKELLRLRTKCNRPDSGIIHVPKEAIIAGQRFYDRDFAGNPIPKNERILYAAALLDSAGWVYNPEHGVREKDGVQLRFEVLLRSDPAFRRVMLDFFDALAKVGIQTADKNVQAPEYQERVDKYDYDMIVNRFFVMNCPSDEQKSYWDSSAVDQKAGENYCGVRNPAIDETIASMKSAATPDSVYFYAGILDRLICANAYLIPQWYSGSWRTLAWNRFGRPAKNFGGGASFWNAHNFWWFDPAKDEALRDAMKNKTDLPAVPCPEASRQERAE